MSGHCSKCGNHPCVCTLIDAIETAQFDQWNADTVQLQEELRKVRAKLAASEASRAELVVALEEISNRFCCPEKTFHDIAQTALANARATMEGSNLTGS